MNRRDFFKFVGIGGAIAGVGALMPTQTAAGRKTGQKYEVKPGELDDYYGFWSGGHSGEVRVLGVPSMRCLKRIPVFNMDVATGWGITNESKKLLRGRFVGDTHHVHGSYRDGTYDGKYIFVNDKANNRVARIRLDYMETDAILDIPNIQGAHGLFPQRYPKTEWLVLNAEFQIPVPNDPGKPKEKYYGVHTIIDAERMEIVCQIILEENLDLAATDYKGKYSMANSYYNPEQGVTISEMLAWDHDYLIVFNWEKVREALRKGAYTMVNGVKVIDGTRKSGYPGLVLRIPVPKNPHGVNVSPGLGPLHTTFDDRGNAYTSCFIDSTVVKWNVQKAIDSPKRSKDAIVDIIDIHYQIGHIMASMAETKEADGKWLIALNKVSKDRFLNVGPLKVENDQLIDISGKKMKLIKDEPAWLEPHDCIIVRRDIVEKNVKHRHNMFEHPQAVTESGITRKGRHVIVRMTANAPVYGLQEIRVKRGDKVTFIVTNNDEIQDLAHGFCISNYNINFVVAPFQTKSVTFTADKAGVFWIYCTNFCHALHLEMRSRFIVEA